MRDDEKTARRTAKLVVCVLIFAIAALMKLFYPETLQFVGDKLNTTVNYKAALATLGEGISGKKKLVTALGEAFTYAFTGAADEPDDATQPTGNDQTGMAPSPSNSVSGASGKITDTDAGADTGGAVADRNETAAGDVPGEETVQTFSETSPEPAPGTVGAAIRESAASEAADAGETFSDAVIAAFLQDQEQYSDYAIPAGVSYGMPKINFDYAAPVKGAVSSPFGYRIHPVDKTVKFHYGTDIAAKNGDAIAAFADGKVISTGESPTLGSYVILKHGSVESVYAHCSKIYVRNGQAVKKGDKIGAVGNKGNATDTCLHFELRVSGVCVNPEFYVQWT
jgi:murein DD-endopeptidase MepM/ murein hydrolase activator NlpD